MSILRLCVILGFIVTSYGVRRFLEEVEVAQAVALLESWYTQRIVAERFDVSRSVVARLWRRYQETGEFTRREGQGRHRMPSQREDQYLRNLALWNRQYTARRLQIDFQHAIGQRISDQTIRNRLHEGDLRARRPARGPILTRQHRARRYEFVPRTSELAIARLAYSSVHGWKQIFHLSACDRRVRVWRRPGERYEDCNIVETDRYGAGSVMVWGGFSYEGRTDLYVINGCTLTALRYWDEILNPIVRTFAGSIGDNFILMQDNARPHTARVCMDYLNR